MTKYDQYLALFKAQGYITKDQANSLLTLKQIQEHIRVNDPETFEDISKRASIWKSKAQLVKCIDYGRYERLNQQIAKRQGFGGSH